MSSGYYETAQIALEQWARWVRRPPVWARLTITGMWALMPIKRDPPRHRGSADYRLDPFSRRLHDGIMQMDERSKTVLYGYYVAGRTWAKAPDTYAAAGIAAQRTFYDCLKNATLTAYNRARS